MPPTRQIVGPVVLSVAAWLTGCEFQVPSPYYIASPTLISVTIEVVELGPLNPDRVGVPFDAPIAEVMPGDRVALEAVVIDADGHRLLGDELESLWVHCGPFDCTASNPPMFDNLAPSELPRCDELDPLTLDDPCRMSEGDHHAEFVVPEIGPLLVDRRVVNFYGIIGVEGRSADECVAMLEARDAQLERCLFVVRPMKVGPSWWLLGYADALGMTPLIPIWQIPAAVFLQAANRVPSPTFEVFVDGRLAGAYPEQTNFEVKAGAKLTIESSYDELEQLTQIYFIATPVLEAETPTYWFRGASEYVLETGYSTRSIHALGDDQYSRPRDWAVDPYAEPGDAQLFIVYQDDRNGEGWARLDFEVTK